MAIAIGTIAVMFSYFPYAAAFARPEGEPGQIDVGLLGIGVAMAPFALVTVAFVSRNPQASRRVLQAMGLLPLIGLGVGLLSPVLGATAAFGVGGTLTLNAPKTYGVYSLRLWFVLGTVVYTLMLLLVITPGGVLAGGLLPLLMLGFADEFTAWRANRQG